MTGKKICILCRKELGGRNASGFCTKCYTKSPTYLKYQRDYQQWLYYEKGYAEKKREHNKILAVKKRIKEYQKVYQKMYNSLADVKENKKIWARNYRERCKTKRLLIAYEKKKIERFK